MKDIKKIAPLVVKYSKDNAPTILTATACVGVVGTSVLSAKGHVKALELLGNDEDYRISKGKQPPTKKEQLNITWKCYAPAALTGSLTIAAVIGSDYLNLREASVLAASYAITEKAFTEYKDKIAEKMPEKVSEIRSEIIQDRLKKDSVTKLPPVNVTENEVLCYEVFSGRYFVSNQDEIDKCVNMLNQALVSDSWVSLNTWYALIGLDNIRIGDDYGWVANHLVEIIYGSNIATDGRPCLTVDFRNDPVADSYKNWN